MTAETTAGDRVARTCERTGLRLVPAAGQKVYRVAQTSFGPLAPLPREADYTDVLTWARWDTAGGRTIYAAEDALFAYLEVLAYLKPSDGLAQLTMREAFPSSTEPADRTSGSVLDQITKEWNSRYSGFGPGKNTQRWREARGLYELTLPADGWFIDITHNDTIAALNRSGGPLGGPFHPTDRVTVANLVDENREWTCRVATLLRGVVLDDGSLPHGISFKSKHGVNGTCWAVWLRRVDDGQDPSTELVTVSGMCEVKHISQNLPLRKAAETFGLTLH